MYYAGEMWRVHDAPKAKYIGQIGFYKKSSERMDSWELIYRIAHNDDSIILTTGKFFVDTLNRGFVEVIHSSGVTGFISAGYFDTALTKLIL